MEGESITRGHHNSLVDCNEMEFLEIKGHVTEKVSLSPTFLEKTDFDSLSISDENEKLLQNKEILLSDNESVLKNIEHHLSLLGTSITSLCLSNMNISSLPDDFQLYSNLARIDLSNNVITSLPISFSKLNKLKYVNLSFNKFVYPPECLTSGLYLIKELDLSHNHIQLFDIPPLCLYLLQVLKLSNNNLTSPPKWLFRELHSSLISLDLSNNPFMLSGINFSYFSRIPHMVASKVLDLKVCNCGLNESNIEFLAYFTFLKKLDLGNQEIYNFKIEKRFCGLNGFQEFPFKSGILCKSLSKLSVRWTSLSGILGSISYFENLEFLDIVKNPLNWLPDSFCLLKNLKIIKASNCGLYFLPEEFGSLLSLQELYLDENMLSSLPKSMENHFNLAVLDLYNNNFSEMPTLSGFNSLKALDVYMNNFEPALEIKINDTVVELKSLKEEIVKLTNINGRLEIKKYAEISDVLDSNDSDLEGPFSEESSGEIQNSNLCEVASLSDENWDENLESDNFDPTVQGTFCRVSPASSGSLSEVSHYLKGDEHFFRPYNNKLLFKGTVNPVYSFTTIEGQFDDL